MQISAVDSQIIISQPNALMERYWRIRQQSETLCKPLLKEDYNLQAMPEVSPPKWHLAHTTWFFEALLLKQFVAGYKAFNSQYDALFNSYYLSIGTPYPRERRGMLTRPTIGDVFNYRRSIDEQILRLLEKPMQAPQLLQRLELGINHEQQHQELFLADIKYNFFANPLQPAYCDSVVALSASAKSDAKRTTWVEFIGGITHIGSDSHQPFCFDNEIPRHRAFLQAYALADRPVNNGEFLAFMQEGGYERPELWLSDGWQKKMQAGWNAPLYWQKVDHKWQIYTLHGSKPLNQADPVCHISYYEADAFARWAGARLPTEAEWENAVATRKVEGHFVCDGILHPRQPCQDAAGLRQMFGDVWEWTASAYAPYPGYTLPQGAVGEYNGKFMCNQMVLRGGSCISEREHIRASYRNFFYPWDRWQFSGARLAKSIG